MKTLFFLTLACLVGLTAPLSAQTPAHIVIMVVEEPFNYEAPRTMGDFAERELRPLGHRVTVILGDQPEKHHFPGLVEAMKDADLLILFSRRRFPPKEQLAAIRAHLEAGKPLLGIRTANHAFIPVPTETVTDTALDTWPEFNPEVLGGQNTGYETKGLPYSVRIAPGAEKNPLIQGVDTATIQGHKSLYKVLPLAADTTPLLIGTAQPPSTTPPQPVAWTRHHGPKKAPIFYTSLGAADDMSIPAVRQLILNGVKWTLNR
jgi:type 1 glutamine amidotransferase